MFQLGKSPVHARELVIYELDGTKEGPTLDLSQVAPATDTAAYRSLRRDQNSQKEKAGYPAWMTGLFRTTLKTAFMIIKIYLNFLCFGKIMEYKY